MEHHENNGFPRTPNITDMQAVRKPRIWCENWRTDRVVKNRTGCETGVHSIT